MNAEQAFLRAIKQQPQEDGPRHIFADWLEENGQPERAELIRVQLDRARLPHEHPLQAQLEQREAELLAAHGKRWLGPLAKNGSFRRGLIQLRCDYRDHLQLPKAVAQEAGLEWVESLTVLWGVSEVLPLLERPWARHLTSLELHLSSASREATALASLESLCNLTSLGLPSCQIGNAGAAALAGSESLRNLLALNLSNNSIRFDGAAALAASENLRKLRVLNLHGNTIGANGAEALAASANLANLTQLDLGMNQVRVEGAVALATSPHLRRLAFLALVYNQIGSEGAEVLASSGFLGNLTHLRLGGNNIGQQGSLALASAALGRLTVLDLWYNHIGDLGAQALADSDHLAHLTTLDLTQNQIGADVTARLRERFGPGLRI